MLGRGGVRAGTRASPRLLPPANCRPASFIPQAGGDCAAADCRGHCGQVLQQDRVPMFSSHILEGDQPPGPGLTGARRRLAGSWSTVKISWFWESGSGGQPRVKPHWLLSRPQPLQPGQLLSHTTCCRHLRPRAMQISTFTIPADGAAQITAQVGLGPLELSTGLREIS